MFTTKQKFVLISVLMVSQWGAAANFPGTDIDDPESHGRLQLFERTLGKGTEVFKGLTDKVHELGLTKESKIIRSLQESGMDVSIVGDNMTVVIPSALFFMPSSSIIQESKKPSLALLAKFIKGHNDRAISLHGYSDRLGGKQKQLTLSEDTAKAVAGALWVHGIPLEHMVSHGHGAQNFVSSRADNRFNARVEVHFQR